jgi:hypothetical protein
MSGPLQATCEDGERPHIAARTIEKATLELRMMCDTLGAVLLMAEGLTQIAADNAVRAGLEAVEPPLSGATKLLV